MKFNLGTMKVVCKSGVLQKCEIMVLVLTTGATQEKNFLIFLRVPIDRDSLSTRQPGCNHVIKVLSYAHGGRGAQFSHSHYKSFKYKNDDLGNGKLAYWLLTLDSPH